MSSKKLPPADSVSALPTEDRAAILDLLFEPSTQLHTLSVPLLHEKQFETYDDLIAAVGVQLTELSASSSTSDTAWLESILGSHPRLGAKKVESAQSQAEQAQLKGSAEEAEQLRALNEEYEERYPGLRYVVFVNGRSRPVIMQDMRTRIANSDLSSERAAAIRAMCEIAADRAVKLLSMSEKLKAKANEPKHRSKADSEFSNIQTKSEKSGDRKQIIVGSGNGAKTQPENANEVWEDVKLSEPVELREVPEDSDYEVLEHTDAQHSSHNSQPDHKWKYPKDFGEKDQE